jgi:hypothetical protein
MLQTWDEIVASTLRSENTIREELQDAIWNVTPHESPLLSRLSQAPIDNDYTQWLIDAYASPSTNAQLEGIAFTHLSLTVPTRAANISQIFYKGGMISDRARSVARAGMADPFVYYEGKHIVELKRDMEIAILKGSAATGTTDTANQMNGFLNFLSTNKTDLSGVTLTETVFTDVLELTWGNTAMMPNEVYVGPKLKRTISQYSTKVTRFLDAKEQTQVLTTDSYASDFGPINHNLHRDLLSTAADTANELLLIDPNWFATGWLQPLRREVLSRDGKRDRYQISAEFTVLYRNEKAGAAVTNCRPYIT